MSRTSVSAAVTGAVSITGVSVPAGRAATVSVLRQDALPAGWHFGTLCAIVKMGGCGESLLHRRDKLVRVFDGPTRPRPQSAMLAQLRG